MCLSSLFYRAGTENQMVWFGRAHRQWLFCQEQPQSTEVSLEPHGHEAMGTAPLHYNMSQMEPDGAPDAPCTLQKARGMAPCSSSIPWGTVFIGTPHRQDTATADAAAPVKN